MINGTSMNDRIFGNAGDDIINGMCGADTITGGGGDDIIIADSACEPDEFTWLDMNVGDIIQFKDDLCVCEATQVDVEMFLGVGISYVDPSGSGGGLPHPYNISVVEGPTLSDPKEGKICA